MADPKEHFLQSLIVSYLSSNIGTPDNDGFLSGTVILNEMARLGYVEEQVVKALQRMAKKRLVETPHAHYREIPVPDEEHATTFYYRATSIGIYHVRYWSGTFAFLDAVAIDTPIFDEPTRVRVAALAASFDLKERAERTKLFRDYLENQWHVANVEANYYDFAALLKSQAQTFEGVDSAMGREKPVRK